MTQKERLVEFIKDYAKMMCINDPVTPAGLAEYLLSNGVIVPPCKVGDTVFFVDEDYNKIRKAKIKGYRIDEDYSYLDVYAGVYDNWYIKFELFNKCLFSTSEEAEQALKEREAK